MSNTEQFWLLPELRLPDKRRTRDGRRERLRGRYINADGAYNRIQNIMQNWRLGYWNFSPRYQAFTGCRDLHEFLAKHEAAFRQIAERLKLRTMDEILAAYGRTGQNRWSWDHLTLHQHDTRTDEGRAAVTNVMNLRPMIACENKPRKLSKPEHPGQIKLPLPIPSDDEPN